MVFHLKFYKGKTINEALNNALSIHLKDAPRYPTCQCMVCLPLLVLY